MNLFNTLKNILMDICGIDGYPSFEVSFEYMMGFSIFSNDLEDGGEIFFTPDIFYKEKDLSTFFLIKREINKQ